MKSLIEIGVVALVVGGLSAAGSFYWQQQLRKAAAAEVVAAPATTDNPADKKPESTELDPVDPESKSEETGRSSKEPKLPAKDDLSVFGPPVAARPPFDPTGDEAGELINKLRLRASTTSRHERRLAEREDVMKLIVDDLRLEQTSSAKVRQRILEESNQSLRAVEESRRQTQEERLAIQHEQIETRRNADEQIQELRREKDEAAQSAENALKAVREEQDQMKRELEELRNPGGGRDKSGSPDEIANLKKMVGVVDSMPPEDTAKILQELVEKGKTQAVVAVLDAMKARQSAKVISVITENNPVLAADLVDRLKKVKKTGTAPSEPGK